MKMTADSHTAALNSILQMCKDCDQSNISTIRTLILQAFTSPDIYAGFDQIKAAVQPALASAPDGETILRTLDLFSYGTYKDIAGASAAGSILTLTDAQMNKMRMLTILSLVEAACTEGNGILPYANVAQELSLPTDTLESNRQVEELIIACIYAGIVHGKLCQKTRSLILSSGGGPPCRPRDVQNVSNMLESFKSLQQNLISTVMSMEAEKSTVEKRREAEQQFLKKLKEANNRTTRASAAAASAAGSGGHSRGREMASSMMRRQKRSRGAPSGMSGPGDAFARM